jgi:serine/threonine protein kinase
MDDEHTDLYKDQGYELREHLASDAWGDLYRAVYVPHGLEVLFRRFRADLHEQPAWELAAAEIQAWARIDHPAVLQPLDWEDHNEGPFLATVMPEGRLLTDCLTGNGAADGLEPREVLAGVARAVEAAREFGVLHLGLDLTNVWVAAPGSVAVSEFGLWYVHSEHPWLGPATSPFAAPEQEGPGRVSAATDAFALGLICVALRFGTSRVDIARRSAPSLPWDDPSESVLISRCLLDDPLARPRTAGELLGLMGDAPGAREPAMRDCPICRLKREIEHDLGLGRRTVVDRLRDLEDTRPEPTSVREGSCARPDKTAAAHQVREPRTWSFVSMFPWLAIAAMALAAMAVWWLAFR